MLCVPRILLCLQLLLGISLCRVEARWTVPTTSTTPNPISRLIDAFDQRSPAGEHEYRYQLSNGDTRYERSFWLPVGKKFVLARTGYYSVPLPNAQYSTVFYRADHRGYYVDAHTLSGEQPSLPRTLDVPHDVAASKSTPAAKRNSISVPERNDKEQLEQPPDARAVASSAMRVSNRSRTKAKVQTVAANMQTENQQQNETKPSTVATVDDIFAAKVGTADDDEDEDDDDVVDDDDASNININ